MKERILEAAKELFIKNGYNATTTGDIVKQSGSSKGNLYHHYGTKENLFLEILRIEDEKWFALWLENEKKCSNNREKFIRFSELSIEADVFFSLQMAIFEFYSREHESSHIRDRIYEIEQRYINKYVEIFQAGNAANEWSIDDIELASQIASATVNGIANYSIHTDKNNRKELINRFSHIFLKGVQRS